MYFSMSADGTFLFHDTEEDAKREAENELECEQDVANSEGWNDCVTQICWGVVKQQVQLVSSTPTPGGKFDSIDEYELKDTK